MERQIRQIREYENRVALLSQQIERLNSIVEAKNREIRSLQQRSGDAENMTKTINTLNDRISRLTGQNDIVNNELKEIQ